MTKPEISETTWFYFLSFAALLIASILIILFIFVELQSGEELSTLSNSAKTQWSQTSDFLSAAIGIPTALAGSIVAIVLAHRAYTVSRQQSRFEEQIYLETAVGNLAEIYWTLSVAMRRVDEAHDFMLADLTRKPDAVKKNAETLSREAVEKAFRSTLKELSQALLAIHKDALAFEAWRAIDHHGVTLRVKNAQSAALKNFSGGELRPMVSKVDTSNLSEVSQEIVIKSRDPRTKFGLLKSFYILLWQTREFGKRVLCADGSYRTKEEIESGEDGLSFVNKIFESQVAASTFDLADLSQKIGSRTALMGERLNTSYGLSSFADIKGGVPSGLIIRDGAFLISAVLLAWPTEEQLENVVLKFVKDRRMDSIDRDVCKRIVRDKNIPAYLPKNMLDDAIAFLSDPNLAVAPSPSPFNGY